MSTQAPNSGLAYDWVMGQSGWGLQMDQNMRALDALLSIDVISSSVNTPPATPADGDRYIIGPEPTGAWSGHSGKIARYINNSWEVYKNYIGRRAYVQDAGSLYRWDGTAWAAIAGGSGGGLPTNLSATRTANDVVINSSTGSGVNIGAASSTVAGLMTAADKSKLDGIDGGGGGGGGGSTPTNITISADEFTVIVESSTGSDGAIGQATYSVAGVMSAQDKQHLDGIENGATANSTDTHLLSRDNHTGTQLASTISDFTEAAQDAAGSMMIAGSGISIAYDDNANTLTVSATGGGGGGGGGGSTWVVTDTTLTKNQNCFTTNMNGLHLPPDMTVGDFVFFKNAAPWENVIYNNYYTINGEFGSVSSGTGLTLAARESLYVVCVSEGVLEII